MYEHFLVAVRESPFQRVLLERFSRAAFFLAVGEVPEPNNSSGGRRRSIDSIPATIKSGWLFRNKDKKRFYTLSSDGLDCVKQGTLFGSSIDKKHAVRFPFSLATAKAADKSLIISVPAQPTGRVSDSRVEGRSVGVGKRNHSTSWHQPTGRDR